MTAALDLRGVAVGLGGRPVLDGLDLALPAGRVSALIGLNGAGKTTALRVALGMLRPSRGSVRVLGADIHVGNAPWGRVGHLVEAPPCYPELTARENIAASATLHGAAPAAAAARAEALSEALGLSSWLDTRVARLSLGPRQKVGIVSALAHDPELAVLDEPTNALDPLAVLAFREIVRGCANRGAAVLVTSHHFDEIARIADAVHVLHRGRVVDTLDPDAGRLEEAFFDVVVAAERSAEAAA